MNARANTAVDKPATLPSGHHGTSEPPAEKAMRRCVHDAGMVNEVTERLLKMKAVGDLMLCSSAGDLAEDTLNNLGWLLVDMIDETKAIVCETKEAQA